MPTIRSILQTTFIAVTAAACSPQVHGQALENADLGPFIVNTIEGPDSNTAYKAVVIKLRKDGEAAVSFDTELLRYQAGWVKATEPAEEKSPAGKNAKPAEKSFWPTGPWAGLIDPNHSTAFTAFHGGPPKIRGGPANMRFVTRIAPGWGGGPGGDDFADPRPVSPKSKQHLGNLPKEWAHYKGLYRHGDQVVLSYTVGDCDVLELPGLIGTGEYPSFTRTIRVGASDKPMKLLVCDGKGLKSSDVPGDQKPKWIMLEKEHADSSPVTAVGVADAPAGYNWSIQTKDGDSHVLLELPARKEPVVLHLVLWSGPKADSENFKTILASSAQHADPSALLKGGPTLWGPALETTGKLESSGGPDDAYVVDTLTAPENNPYHSFVRFCGFDFFPDGHSAAISTIGGDVWIVSGIDDKLEHLKWKRFATGLFQPLGLKIRDGVVYTVGRDQITALHDLDGDGEADFYENFNNDCQVTANYHEFTLDIQTDSQGNFYYSKGCPWPPDVTSDDQGTMIKVSKDGKKFDIFCTGLRAANGSAMNEKDELYTGDNEGHWTPSSKFEHLRQGKFYGMVPGAHAAVQPTTFEPPVFWLPHGGVDNSSGAMAFAPENGKWGPLNGHMLAASYGLSSLFAAMTEEVDGVEQGAAVKLPLKFGSSVMRARFNGGREYPKGDGQLYLCGLKGWQTNAGRDGAFERVRYTGKAWRAPEAFHAGSNGLLVSFSEPLDKDSATDAGNWGVEQWNYHWTQNYGSPEFSLKDPTRAKHDELDVKSVSLSSDGKTVLLHIDGLAPVMQVKTRYNIKDTGGKDLKGDIYSTINKVGAERNP